MTERFVTVGDDHRAYIFDMARAVAGKHGRLVARVYAGLSEAQHICHLLNQVADQ